MSAGNPTNKWRSSELRCSCCRGYGFHPPQTDKQHPQHSIDPLRLASGPVENEALGVLMSVRGRQSLSSQSEHPFSCSCTAHCSFSLTNTTHSFGFINTSSFLRLNPNDRVSKKRIICLTKTSSRFDFPLAFSENPQTFLCFLQQKHQSWTSWWPSFFRSKNDWTPSNQAGLSWNCKSHLSGTSFQRLCSDFSRRRCPVTEPFKESQTITIL